MKGKDVANAWDKIDGYINWCVEWLTLCSKKLKPNGVLYFWHNDMGQIAELLMEIRKRTALRSWFNTCECCLHSFNAPIKLPGTE